MREEDSNWFSKWEEELPSPEELTPISQTLISRDLAAAFDIQSPISNANFSNSHFFNHQAARSNRSGDFDSSSGGGSDEPARTLKRPRLVWTPQLHKRFVDAVAHLGIKNAVPKTIMQLMSVDGLTRENVASHLQKYRLYLKRMQGINNGGSGGAGSGDSATDHLFASAPVPAHFLNAGAGGYAPSLQHHHHQVAAMVAGGQYPGHRQLGQFDHPLLGRQLQTQMNPVAQNSVPGLDSASGANGRKVLTLFPSAEN